MSDAFSMSKSFAPNTSQLQTGMKTRVYTEQELLSEIDGLSVDQADNLSDLEEPDGTRSGTVATANMSIKSININDMTL